MFRSALLTLLLAPVISVAQVAVPANVESVTSGGYWENDGASGRYRIVVVNSGFDAVTSRLFVQWIRDPKSLGSEPEVVASHEAMFPFGESLASFSARLKPEGRGRARITVEGVVSREPRKKVRAVLVVTSPGHVAP